jgi:hypothetical protein
MSEMKLTSSEFPAQPQWLLFLHCVRWTHCSPNLSWENKPPQNMHSASSSSSSVSIGMGSSKSGLWAAGPNMLWIGFPIAWCFCSNQLLDWFCFLLTLGNGEFVSQTDYSFLFRRFHCGEVGFALFQLASTWRTAHKQWCFTPQISWSCLWCVR